MNWPCPDPQFPYDETHGWYEACTACGRLAWSHEQADPVADLNNQIDQDRWTRPGRPAPPVMRP